MNEAIALSKLASKLLLELTDISDSVDEDETIHARSIEAILDAFERVDYIVSQRTPEPEETHEPDHTTSASDDDESVN